MPAARNGRRGDRRRCAHRSWIGERHIDVGWVIAAMSARLLVLLGVRRHRVTMGNSAELCGFDGWADLAREQRGALGADVGGEVVAVAVLRGGERRGSELTQRLVEQGGVRQQCLCVSDRVVVGVERRDAGESIAAALSLSTWSNISLIAAMATRAAESLLAAALRSRLRPVSCVTPLVGVPSSSAVTSLFADTLQPCRPSSLEQALR